MSGIDIAFGVIILVSALVGVARGLVREMLSLVVWVTALGLAWTYHKTGADLLTAQIAEPSMRLAVAFVVIVVVVLLIGAVVGWLLTLAIEGIRLGGADRALGFFFGAARGVLLVAMGVYLAGLTPMPAEPWWTESQTIAPLQSVAGWVMSLVPPEIQDQLKMV